MRFRVSGSSMTPLLEDGDVVLVDTEAFASKAPAEGDVVLVRHPYRRDVALVKRVASVEDDGRLFLAGDCPAESTDSRSFGTVRADLVVGAVVLPGEGDPA